MTTFIALLRAVNVGGTGKLPMADLRRLCSAAGFQSVRTYIASGNVVFESPLDEVSAKARLEAALTTYASRPMKVIIRTAAEMARVLEENPFSQADPSRTVVVFLDCAPSPDALVGVVVPDGEQVDLGERTIYIAYGETMGRSKLRVPAAAGGTARNMNTVAKLVEMTSPQ